MTYARSFVPRWYVSLLIVLLTVGGSWGVWEKATEGWYVHPVLKDLGWHDNFLVLTYDVVKNPCVRYGNHSIYRLVGGAPSDFYPLGATLNGPTVTPKGIDTYSLWFDIPRNLPEGEWRYILRVWYECFPMGLVHYGHVTEPTVIHLPR